MRRILTKQERKKKMALALERRLNSLDTPSFFWRELNKPYLRGVIRSCAVKTEGVDLYKAELLAQVVDIATHTFKVTTKDLAYEARKASLWAQNSTSSYFTPTPKEIPDERFEAFNFPPQIRRLFKSGINIWSKKKTWSLSYESRKYLKIVDKPWYVTHLGEINGDVMSEEFLLRRKMRRERLWQYLYGSKDYDDYGNLYRKHKIKISKEDLQEVRDSLCIGYSC